MQGIHLANRLVHHTAKTNPEYHGMGSTLAVIMTDDPGLWLVNVGDSRILRMRDHQLKRLTVDHRVSDDPKLKGIINSEASIMSNLGTTLTRAMGIRDQVDPDVHQATIHDQDLFLICSDGLTDTVEEDQIERILSLERSIDRRARDLIDLALANGGHDNVTVILAEAHTRRKLKGLLSKWGKRR